MSNQKDEAKIWVCALCGTPSYKSCRHHQANKHPDNWLISKSDYYAVKKESDKRKTKFIFNPDTVLKDNDQPKGGSDKCYFHTV